MSDKVALVTGAGSGIGKAAALALARRPAGRGAGRPSARGAGETAAAAIEARGRRALAVATDVGDPAPVEALFAARRGGVRPARPAVQQRRRRRAAASPIEDLDVRAVEGGGRRQPDRRLPVRARRRSGMMKGQDPQRRADHQQRLDLGAPPRPNSAPYTATKHAITGLTKSTALDGRAYDIACGQIDIGNALTEMALHDDQGVLQADGRSRPSR